jgi:hypothetical protein
MRRSGRRTAPPTRSAALPSAGYGKWLRRKWASIGVELPLNASSGAAAASGSDRDGLLEQEGAFSDATPASDRVLIRLSR